MSTITERVKNLVAEHLGLDVEECTLDSDIIELGADSIDQVEMLMEIEEQFECEIADEDADGFKTIQNIISYLERNAPPE